MQQGNSFMFGLLHHMQHCRVIPLLKCVVTGQDGEVMIMVMGGMVRGLDEDLGVRGWDYRDDRVDRWHGVCYSEKLTPEVAINEHPATCGAVYVSFRVDLCSALRRRQLCSPQAGRQTGQQRKAVIYSTCLIKQSFETPVEECFYEKYAAMVNQIETLMSWQTWN